VWVEWSRRIDAVPGENQGMAASLQETEDADIYAEGRASIASENIGHVDVPYQAGNTAATVVQSFEVVLTGIFIHEQV
jgi:hypothetical protein